MPIHLAQSWPAHEAVLFDLDGVVTPTAEVHMRAWSHMFNTWLDGLRASGDAPAEADEAEDEDEADEADEADDAEVTL